MSGKAQITVTASTLFRVVRYEDYEGYDFEFYLMVLGAISFFDYFKNSDKLKEPLDSLPGFTKAETILISNLVDITFSGGDMSDGYLFSVEDYYMENEYDSLIEAFTQLIEKGIVLIDGNCLSLDTCELMEVWCF